jgi:hypothetical protein
MLAGVGFVGAFLVYGGLVVVLQLVLGGALTRTRRVTGRVVGAVRARLDEGYPGHEDDLKDHDPAREVLYPVFAYDLGDRVERWARAGEGGRYVAAYRTGQAVALRVTPCAYGDTVQDARRESLEWAFWMMLVFCAALVPLGFWLLLRAVGLVATLCIVAVCAAMTLVGVDWRALLKAPPPDRPENVDRAEVRPVEDLAREMT